MGPANMRVLSAALVLAIAASVASACPSGRCYCRQCITIRGEHLFGECLNGRQCTRTCQCEAGSLVGTIKNMTPAEEFAASAKAQEAPAQDNPLAIAVSAGAAGGAIAVAVMMAVSRRITQPTLLG